jgi:hypothetical protein
MTYLKETFNVKIDKQDPVETGTYDHMIWYELEYEEEPELMFDTYHHDVKIEEFEDEKEPELADYDSVFSWKLEGIIEELKMGKFDERYTKEEKEHIQDVEDEREMIREESEKLKSIVNDTIMKKEFDEKENDGTIRDHVSAINNSFVKPTVSEVDGKEYLEKEVFEKDDDVIFEKLADMVEMMGVESMGEDGKIVDQASQVDLNKAIDKECEKDTGNTDFLIKHLPRLLFRNDMDQSAEKQQAREAVGNEWTMILELWSRRS